MGQKMKELVETEYNMERNCHLWPEAWNRIISGEAKTNYYSIEYGKTGRNSLCPCGSGIKSKKCQCFPSFK